MYVVLTAGAPKRLFFINAYTNSFFLKILLQNNKKTQQVSFDQYAQ